MTSRFALVVAAAAVMMVGMSTASEAGQHRHKTERSWCPTTWVDHHRAEKAPKAHAKKKEAKVVVKKAKPAKVEKKAEKKPAAKKDAKKA